MTRRKPTRYQPLSPKPEASKAEAQEPKRRDPLAFLDELAPILTLGGHLKSGH